MLFVMVSLLIVYWVLLSLGRFQKIRGSRTFSHEVDRGALQAGDQLHIRLKVGLSGLMPASFFVVREVLKRHNGESWSFEESVLTKLRGGGEIKFQTPPLERGRYAFENTEIISEDIFGLLEQKRVSRIPGEFRVLPRMIFIPHWQLFDRNSQRAGTETAVSLSRRETTQINGVRDYVYGDRISRIHWNATAKTGTWKSKEFEHESMPKTVLVLDGRKSSYVSDAQFELAISTTASLLEYGARERMSMGLCTLGDKFQAFMPQAGYMDRQRMLNHLVDLDADGYGNAKARLELRSDFFTSGMFFVFVSPEADEEILDLLVWARVRQMTPYHVEIGDPLHSGEKSGKWQTILLQHGLRGVYVPSLQELPSAMGGLRYG
ncbi:DUF58 domain-containing protein [Paenibacillus sp. CAA11]|uniref:DUF58 domain-containing protein n=1 Tax=Paenibacillus sp. CAA11 TaxID=1532905 RepID=UPI001F29A0EC|nr:DUF58 domain-containing protein [Paenibacillus sp. CAA11]